MRMTALLLAVALMGGGYHLVGDATLASSQHKAPLGPAAAQVVLTPPPPSPTMASPTAEHTASVATAPATASTGVVWGLVSNGTSGAHLPSGLDAVLHGLDEGQVETVTKTAPVGEDGLYRFEGVESAPGRLYAVTVEYLGVIYASELSHLASGDEALELPVVVYETTEDVTQVRVDRLHVVIDFPAQDVAEVIQLWVVSNLGDRTVTGADGSLRIDLPQGASGLSFQESEPSSRYLPTAGGFADSEPLLPGVGSGQLVFGFQLPYQGQLEFAQPVVYPIQAVVILLAEDAPEVSGEGVQDGGIREAAGETLHSYMAGPLAPGQALRFTLSGKVPAVGVAGQNTLLNVGIGAGALVIGLLLAGFLWMRWSARRPTSTLGHAAASSATPVWSGDPALEASLRALAHLDDEFSAGKIAQDEYRRQREELRRRALELMKGKHD